MIKLSSHIRIMSVKTSTFSPMRIRPGGPIRIMYLQQFHTNNSSSNLPIQSHTNVPSDIHSHYLTQTLLYLRKKPLLVSPVPAAPALSCRVRRSKGEEERRWWRGRLLPVSVLESLRVIAPARPPSASSFSLSFSPLQPLQKTREGQDECWMNICSTVCEFLGVPL